MNRRINNQTSIISARLDWCKADNQFAAAEAFTRPLVFQTFSRSKSISKPVFYIELNVTFVDIDRILQKRNAWHYLHKHDIIKDQTRHHAPLYRRREQKGIDVRGHSLFWILFSSHLMPISNSKLIRDTSLCSRRSDESRELSQVETLIWRKSVFNMLWFRTTLKTTPRHLGSFDLPVGRLASTTYYTKYFPRSEMRPSDADESDIPAHFRVHLRAGSTSAHRTWYYSRRHGVVTYAYRCGV